MRRFTRLYLDLDASTRTTEKVSALEAYFRETEARDAAWALFFLCGERIKRLVPAARLREWTVEASGLPAWLVNECREAVGDSAETMAMLCCGVGAPEGAGPPPSSLRAYIEDRLLPMRRMSAEEQRRVVLEVWAALDEPGRMVWNKLITGAFRVGAGRRLAIRAMAEVAGVSAAEMEHRVMGRWSPTAEDYRRIIGSGATGDGAADRAPDPCRPYPFFLAHQLLSEPESLGEIGEWQVEWKWDGVRAQVIRRDGRTLIWTRGEELVTARYPEIAADAAALPAGTVLDGEVLAWESGRALPFASLQRRMGRVREEPRLFPEVPVVFMAYDVLERAGRDIRGEALSVRREMLREIVARAAVDGASALLLSETPPCATWAEAGALRSTSRERGVEGLMLKRRAAGYGVGRTRGDWWKWKTEPYRIDAVLIAAQPGSGRRGGLYTDYTFGVWDGGALTPVAKAYSGLSNDEIAEVDAWVRRHTVSRHGPVRAVEPTLVFELGFEGVQESRRHRSGLAVRFPRMLRRRTDKAAAEADTLETLRAMLHGGRA